jgi:hypothetical protein
MQHKIIKGLSIKTMHQKLPQKQWFAEAMKKLQKLAFRPEP